MEQNSAALSWLECPPLTFNRFVVGDAAAFLHKTVNITADALHIGRFSYIGSGTVLDGRYPIYIGAFCSIASHVHISTSDNHDLLHISTSPLRTILGMPIAYPEVVQRPQGVMIGNDVYIGQGAFIMSGVTIGNGAVVGAHAVVTRDLEPYGVYAGVPARLIRKRFADPMIKALQEIKYWDWSLEKILRNVEFFNLNLENVQDPDILYQSICD